MQASRKILRGRREHANMAHRIAHWTFLVAALLVAPGAFAQSDNEPPPPGAMPPGGEQPPMQPPMQGGRPPRGGGGGGGLRAACGPDIARLCRGVPPGGGRIVQCLMSRRGGLSPMCNAQLASMGPGGGGGGMPPPGYG